MFRAQTLRRHFWGNGCTSSISVSTINYFCVFLPPSISLLFPLSLSSSLPPSLSPSLPLSLPPSLPPPPPSLSLPLSRSLPPSLLPYPPSPLSFPPSLPPSLPPRALGGELFRVIAVDPLPEVKARDVVFQILQGVRHLHSLNIVHMDLKVTISTNAFYPSIHYTSLCSIIYRSCMFILFVRQSIGAGFRQSKISMRFTKRRAMTVSDNCAVLFFFKFASHLSVSIYAP